MTPIIMTQRTSPQMVLLSRSLKRRFKYFEIRFVSNHGSDVTNELECRRGDMPRNDDLFCALQELAVFGCSITL